MDPAAMQVLHYVLEARRRGEAQTVSLPGADLAGAQLLRADLVGAELCGAGMDHAVLAGAKLGRADLRGALLRSADLAGADLTGADLRDADLSGARVEGACLSDCDLRGALIAGAVGEPSDLAGARIDSLTAIRSRLPDDEVIQLWRGGVVIDDLESFGDRVRRACSPEAADTPSEAGPSTRRLADVEREARRQRLQQDDETPPSARVTTEILRASLVGEEPAPMSVRSLQLVAGILTPAMLQAPSWQAGDVLLGVTLESVIGEGVSARVWRGSDAGGRAVALKLFRTERASVGLSLSAYRRGVAVMNRLTARGDDVPGVVELSCVSLNKLGFVMDLAENGSAVDLPALGWSVKSAVAFFEKLCLVVEQAHAAGALHRCLKPQNVLLNADLDPLLSDFDMVDLPTLAAESFDAGGYLPYAAPEELLGAGTQSPTADIYSLGRILYFLLLGSDPEEKVADVPVLAALDNQPAGLTRIIRKCTMRAPEQRYQWVGELVDDLRDYQEYDRVGVAGGATEHNFLPHRISSLSHKTPWLRSADKAPSDRPPARSASSDRPRAPSQKRRRGPPGSEPTWTPAHDRRLGAGGFAVLAASVVVVLVTQHHTSAGLLSKMHLASVLGGAVATFLIPRFENNAGTWRTLFVIGMAVALWFANVPALVLPSGYIPP